MTPVLGYPVTGGLESLRHLSRPLSNNEGDQAQKCLRFIKNEGDMEIKYKWHTKFAIFWCFFTVVFPSCFP